MDSIKAIDMCHEIFGKIGEPHADDEILWRSDYSQYRKVTEKFLEWYESNRGKKLKEKIAGGKMREIQPIQVTAIPETTGIEDLKEYEKEFMPLFKEFNRIGMDVETARDHLDGYLDRLKAGWLTKLRNLRET